MNDRSKRVARAGIRTSATRQQAWEAWSDAEKIAHWFVDRAEGSGEPGSTMVWEFERFGMKLPYTVVASEPGRLFTLGWNMPGYPSGLLEVTITTEGGHTKVMLVNSGFREGAEWDEEYQGIASGWKMSMATLKLYLERYFGRPKRTAFAMKPAAFEYEAARPFRHQERLLKQWLVRNGSVPEHEGQTYRLELPGGRVANGSVLCSTEREVILSWPEISGTLELKTFGGGAGRRTIALRAISWSAPQGEMAAIERHFEASLDKLAAALG